ncbi:hypothetical protein [Spirosoma gilvum]
MSLFDFPRVHFSGNVDINVPTMNNAFYFPLALYDQTKSVAFIPPRLYFSKKEIIQGVTPPIPNLPIYFDELNQYYYIEIEPINTIQLLRTWCMTPLGSPELPDVAYKPYYEAANLDLATLEGCNPITGQCPGYWNMYGDMSVALSDVSVTGVQTFDGSQINTWTKETPNLPDSISTLLQASLDFDSVPGNGTTTACMVETISSQSIYANIFCDTVNLFDSSSGEVYFSGGPLRFGALIYSGFRVVNWMPPMAGSGRFCSAVLLDELDTSQKMALIQFFTNNKDYDNRPLKGVFVTFAILEVFENRFDQNYYSKNGTKSNPAQATIVGSLTPWYEGDMYSGVIGRNLTAFQPGIKPIYQNSTVGPVDMAPVTASLREIDGGKAIFSLDMGNSWPEMMSSAMSQPAHRGDATFESACLGVLQVCCSNNPATILATIPINPADNSRASVFTTGCLFDFVLNDPSVIEAARCNLINVYLQTSPSDQPLPILQESDYMICLDQKGLYAEQGDLPSGGYRVNSSNREPCTIRIFQKGLPVTTPITLIVGEFAVPEAGNDPMGAPGQVKSLQLADMSTVDLSVFQSPLSYSAVYYFTYPGQYNNNTIPVFAPSGYTVMDTGSFLCLRVLPAKDYSQYLDAAHPNYTPPDFTVVYNEIFQLYDVNYPVMAEVQPFTAQVWETPLMAELVGKYTSPDFWNQIAYMPRSRELSACQYDLLQAWIKKVKGTTIN